MFDLLGGDETNIVSLILLACLSNETVMKYPGRVLGPTAGSITSHLLAFFPCFVALIHSEIPCPKVKGRREGKRRKVACPKGKEEGLFFAGLFIERCGRCCLYAFLPILLFLKGQMSTMLSLTSDLFYLLERSPRIPARNLTPAFVKKSILNFISCPSSSLSYLLSCSLLKPGGECLLSASILYSYPSLSFRENLPLPWYPPSNKLILIQIK